MAKRQFKLGDSAMMLIRTMDVQAEALAMAERLGIAGQVETTVGRWDERGRIIGWTKKGNTGLGNEVLVEVFISDLTGSDRERDRAAREMQKLIDEIADLKALLAGYKSVADAIEKAQP